MISQTLTFPMPHPVSQIVLSGLFLLHALFMNLVLGGTLVMVVTEMLRCRNPQTEMTRFARVLAAWLPIAFICAVILGVVSLMGVQVLYGRVAIQTIGVMGNHWLGAGAGLLIGYGGLHLNRWRREWFEAHPRWLLLLMSGSAVGLLGVALVFVLGSVIMLETELWVDREGAVPNGLLALPSVWPRFFHMVCAAVAGVGMGIAGYGVCLRSQWNRAWGDHHKGEEEYGLWVTRFGVMWMMTGTLPQIVIGPWLLMMLPDIVRHHLIMGDTFGSLAFFLALTCALFSLVLLNAALMVPSVRGFVVSGVTSLILTIGLMVVVRETVRFVALGPFMDGSRVPSEMPWVEILVIIIILPICAGYIWHRVCLAGVFSRQSESSEFSDTVPRSSSS